MFVTNSLTFASGSAIKTSSGVLKLLTETGGAILTDLSGTNLNHFSAQDFNDRYGPIPASTNILTISGDGSHLTGIAGGATNLLGTNWNLLVVGDSRSAQTNILPQWQISWPYQFTNSGYAHGATFVNKAVQGIGLNYHISQYNADVLPYAPVTTGKPALLVLWIGINDASTLFTNQASAATYFSNYNAYVYRAKTNGFLVVGATEFVASNNMSASGVMGTYYFNAMVRSCTNLWRVADIAGVIPDTTITNLVQDGTHPTANGYRAISESFQAAILGQVPAGGSWANTPNAPQQSDVSVSPLLSKGASVVSTIAGSLYVEPETSAGATFLNFHRGTGGVAVLDGTGNIFRDFFFADGSGKLAANNDAGNINWTAAGALNVSNTVTATGFRTTSGSFTGNGSGLTNIPPASVTNAAGFWLAAPASGGGSNFVVAAAGDVIVTNNLTFASGSAIKTSSGVLRLMAESGGGLLTDLTGTNLNHFSAQDFNDIYGTIPASTNIMTKKGNGAGLTVTNSPIYGSLLFSPDGTNYANSQSLIWSNMNLTLRSNGINTVTLSTNGDVEFTAASASRLILTPLGTNTLNNIGSTNTPFIWARLTNNAGVAYSSRPISFSMFGGGSNLLEAPITASMVTLNAGNVVIGALGSEIVFRTASMLDTGASAVLTHPSAISFFINSNLKLSTTAQAVNIMTNLTVSGGIVVTNSATTLTTNTISFTTVSACTNTLGGDATASISAGTSVILQDRNGNTVDTIGTIASLHLLVPMRANMRLAGTGISCVIY